jgi:hypothetical protein
MDRVRARGMMQLLAALGGVAIIGACGGGSIGGSPGYPSGDLGPHATDSDPFGQVDLPPGNPGDPNADSDGDGYSRAQGDCNDGDPNVNPNAMEVADKVDNDCDGQVDEVAPPCDNLPPSASAAMDLAKAMDLCGQVLSATFGASENPQARAVLSRLAQAKTNLGAPRKGNTMAALSTGLAIYDPYQHQCPQSGTDFGGSGADPDPKAIDGRAMDPSTLSLKVRVPSNARSFSFDFHFLTSEYPEYLDTEFNDTFWVTLSSKKFNGNISFDKNGTPIRLNAAFFDVCDPSPAKPKTQSFCTTGASALEGTGYYKECSEKGGWGGGGALEANGGSTGWLTTTAPVEPGETITLTFKIFDKGDGVLDSTVLIDNFRWKLEAAKGPETLPKID